MKKEQQYAPLDSQSSQLVNDEVWLQKVPKEYRQTIEEQAKINDIPVSTEVKMLLIENPKFDPNAVSHTGAVGLTQMLPSTGRDLGYTPEQLKDPYHSITAGAKYLGQQNKRFNGNEDYALGAYNMGPGHMNQILAGKADWTAEGKAYIDKAHMLSMSGGMSRGDPQIASNNGMPNTSDTASRLNDIPSTWGMMARSPFPKIEPPMAEVDNDELPTPAGLIAMAKQFSQTNKAKRRSLEG